MRALTATAALAAAVLACGGGSPSAPPPPVPPPEPTPISFTPAGNGGSNSLSLAVSQGTDENTLVLVLLATDVEDLYALAFDLLFPSDLLSFDSAEEEDFLRGNDGAATSLQVVESPTGTLVVGLTLLGEVDGREGSGVLLTLQFSRAGEGSGELSFENRSAFSSDGQVQGDISWEAGMVTVPAAGS